MSREVTVRRQRGIALFQVLLMTAIFSILLLLMVASVQQNIRQTQSLLDASREQLTLYSASKALSFALLTEDWLGANSGETRYGWNFYGYPFDWLQSSRMHEVSSFMAEEEPSRVQVRIQDVNGLLDLRYPGQLLQQWLQAQGISSLDASGMVRQLRDAQRTEAGRLSFPAPGLFLQDPSEVVALPAWQSQSPIELRQVARMHGDEFNYLTAPDAVLASLLPQAQFDILRQWRNQGQVDRFRFSELTGIEPEEGASFFPGKELMLLLQLGSQQRQLSLRIDAGADIPVLIRQQRRGGVTSMPTDSTRG